jgi:hypothetical protein
MPRVKICFVDSVVNHFGEEYRYLLRSDSSGWEEISQKDYNRLLDKKDLLRKILVSQGVIGYGSEVVILAQDVVTPSNSLVKINEMMDDISKIERRRRKRLRWRARRSRGSLNESKISK